MRGFALLELLVVVLIIGLLAFFFVRGMGGGAASLFSPGTPQQAQEGSQAIQEAQRVTQQFNSAERNAQRIRSHQGSKTAEHQKLQTQKEQDIQIT